MMNTAIWGIGKFGQYVYSQLKVNERIRVTCFIDNSVQEDAEDVFAGIPVVSPVIYTEKYSIHTNFVLVAFAGSVNIVDQLRGLGIKRFGLIDRRVYTFRMSLHNDLEHEPNIIWNDDEVLSKACMDTLETNVVDYCNMNCKGCSHFSNLFPGGSGIPFETFERDIKQLSTKVFISQFNLLGGEVFLSGRLVDYITVLKKYMPKTKIELVSNGLPIVNQEEEILEFIRDNEVAVSITEYPPTSKVLSKIKDTLEKYQILYNVRPLVKTFGKNIDISGRNDPNVAMLNCRESKCQFLRDGKIYKCPFAALGNYFFEYYKIPICLHERIDIYDCKMNWKEEIKKLCNEPIEACRYCGIEERFPWKRSDYPSKEEWLI